MLTLLRVAVAVPVLVNVTGCDALLPTITEPKLSEVGDAVMLAVALLPPPEPVAPPPEPVVPPPDPVVPPPEPVVPPVVPPPDPAPVVDPGFDPDGDVVDVELVCDGGGPKLAMLG